MENYHLRKHGKVWKLKKEGSDRALKVFDTKKEGMEYSKDYVGDKGGSLKVAKEDGTFQEERTYPRSKDPTESKG